MAPHRPLPRLSPLALGLALTACGGGNLDGDRNTGTGPVTPDRVSGHFIDAPVQGLRFVTPSGSGFTDAGGTFLYRRGESVNFFIGDIALGRTTGAEIVTPVDLVPDANDENHPQVSNLLRFLQALDEDGFPFNGIRIEEDTHTALKGQRLDFSQSPQDFAADFAILSDAALGGIALVDADEARDHMRDTLQAVEADLGRIRISGPDTRDIGPLFLPKEGSGDSNILFTMVSWAGTQGDLLYILGSPSGSTVHSLNYVITVIRPGERPLSFEIGYYSYTIECTPQPADGCDAIELDPGRQRLTLKQVPLQPSNREASTENSATDAIRLTGTLRWEAD